MLEDLGPLNTTQTKPNPLKICPRTTVQLEWVAGPTGTVGGAHNP